MSKLTSFEKAKRAHDELGRVICGTACLLLSQGNFLLQKRAGAHGAGCWAPPGGWVEAGEHPVDTIIREVWEEVGVTISAPDFLTFTFDQHPEGIENVCLWFSSDVWTGTPRAAYDARVEDIRWVTWNTLPQPLFPSFAESSFKLQEALRG